MIRREKHVLNDTRVQLVAVSGVILMRKNKNTLAISVSVGCGGQSKRSGSCIILRDKILAGTRPSVLRA